MKREGIYIVREIETEISINIWEDILKKSKHITLKVPCFPQVTSPWIHILEIVDEKYEQEKVPFPSLLDYNIYDDRPKRKWIPHGPQSYKFHTL